MRKTTWNKKPRMVNWRKTHKMVMRAGKALVIVGVENPITQNYRLCPIPYTWLPAWERYFGERLIVID